MVKPETIRMSNIIQTGRVVAILLEIYLIMTNNKKRHEFEKSKEMDMEWIRWRKGKKKKHNYIVI